MYDIDEINIYEIDTLSEPVVIAGISEEDVKDYIIERYKDFPSIDAKNFDVEDTFAQFGMEVFYVNTLIELLHTVGSIDLLDEDQDLYKKDIAFTYEIERILVKKNEDRVSKITIEEL